MDIRKTLVPKKTGGGNTTINYGFSSTINNNSSNTNINTDNLEVVNLNSSYITASQLVANDITATNATINNINTNIIQGVTGLYSYITTTGITAHDGQFDNLNVTNTTTTQDLNVTNEAIIHYLTTEGASLGGTTLFDTLIGDSITVENLEVLKSAHFFELIIDKIKAAGGSILVTPADGFDVESSYTYNEPKYDSANNSYTLYWQAAEDTYQNLNSYIGYTLSQLTAEFTQDEFNPPAVLIENMWQAGDQAICQEFNVKEGTNYNVSNQYWWRVVRDASREPILLEKTEGEYALYNWIEVYAKNSQQKPDVVDGDTQIIEGETTYGHANPPKVGDTVAMLGNRNCQDSGATSDVQRRGSAIYLATYRSIDSGLTPPLFATYKLINDFDLASHRQNKIDANGTTFKGEFISESGDILDGQSFRIIPSSNIITSTTITGVASVTPENLQINYLYQASGQATTSNTVPSNYHLGWTTKNKTGIIATGTFNGGQTSILTLPSTLDKLDMELYTTVNTEKKVRDAMTMQVVYLNNLKDGINGSSTKFIYKDVKKTAADPTIDSQLRCDVIPNGWYTYQPLIDSTYNMWMANGTVTYNSANIANYSYWSKPINIMGEDGQPGTDGTNYEFIYKNFTGVQTFTGQYNPANWPAVQSPDYFGPTGYQWTDNPVGITEATPYQYVAVREKATGIWGTFSEPTLWSKWGEKGQDGDGVKYIFAKNTTPNMAPNAPSWVWTPTDTSNKYKYNGSVCWYDEPINPEENYPVYCSQSVTSSDGYWSDWSEPRIWATWAQPGVNGRDGVTRKMLPLSEVCEIQLDYSGNNDLTCNGRMITDLKYQIIEYNATGVISTVDLPNNSAYKVTSYIYNTANNQMMLYDGNGTAINDWYYNGGNQRYWLWNSNDKYAYLDSKKQYGTSSNNWLRDINGAGKYSSNDYRDFYKLLMAGASGGMGATGIYRTPAKLAVELGYKYPGSNTWKTVDSIIYDINLPAKGTLEHNAYVFRSVLQGSWTGPGGTTIYGLSSLNQTVHGLESSVTEISTQVTGVQGQLSNKVDNSTFTQTVSGINASVSSVQTDLHTNYSTTTTTQGMINTSATGILSTVSTTYETKTSANTSYTTLSSAINQTDNSIKLGVYEQSTMGDNLFKKPDFPTNWNSGTERWKAYNRGTTEVTTPSTIGISRETRTDYMHNNHTSIAIDMSYDMSGLVFCPDIRQNIYDSSYIPAGTNIMMSMYVKMQPATGQTTSANSVIGMDIYNDTADSSDTIVVYFDNKYVNSGFTNGTRSWGQVGAQYMKDTNWHYFQYMCKTKVDLKLSNTRARIFGWHSGTNDSPTPQTIDYTKQPIFYVSEPVVSIDNSGVTNDRIKNTGIDIEQGKITLNADNTIITGNLTGDDNSAILLQNLRNEPTENLFLHTGEIKSSLGINFSNIRSTQVSDTSQKTEYSDDIFTIGSFPANSVLTLEGLELDSLENIDTCSSIVQYSINSGATWNTISINSSITLSNATTVIVRQRFTYTPSSTGAIFIGGYGNFAIVTDVQNIGQISPRGYVHTDYITYDSSSEKWVHNYDTISSTHPISRTSFDGLKWRVIRNNTDSGIEPIAETFPFGMTINFDDEKILQHYEAKYYRSDQSKWIDPKAMNCSVGSIQQVSSYISQTGNTSANLFDFTNEDVICLNSGCKFLYIDADQFTGSNYGKISQVGRRWTILGRNTDLKICGKNGQQPSVRIYKSNVANPMSELTIGNSMIELICIGRSIYYIDFIVGFYS